MVVPYTRRLLTDKNHYLVKAVWASRITVIPLRSSNGALETFEAIKRSTPHYLVATNRKRKRSRHTHSRSWLRFTFREVRIEIVGRIGIAVVSILHCPSIVPFPRFIGWFVIRYRAGGAFEVRRRPTRRRYHRRQLRLRRRSRRRRPPTRTWLPSWCTCIPAWCLRRRGWLCPSSIFATTSHRAHPNPHHQQQHQPVLVPPPLPLLPHPQRRQHRQRRHQPQPRILPRHVRVQRPRVVRVKAPFRRQEAPRRRVVVSASNVHQPADAVKLCPQEAKGRLELPLLLQDAAKISRAPYPPREEEPGRRPAPSSVPLLENSSPNWLTQIQLPTV